MIDHQPLVSLLRLHDGTPDRATFPAPAAVCTLQWEWPASVWIVGLKGRASRGMLRELVEFLAGHGVRTIKAHRSAVHSLPLGRPHPDGHFEIDIREISERLRWSPPQGTDNSRSARAP